jgi:SCF-associated factor 1
VIWMEEFGHGVSSWMRLKVWGVMILIIGCVIGQMDGSMFGLRAQDWGDKHCPVIEPTVVPLPCKAESISVGRRHCLVLDDDNLIWELPAWGKVSPIRVHHEGYKPADVMGPQAYHHTDSALTSPTNPGSSTHPRHITQVSAGWDHSACLTAKGDIHIWYPFSQPYIDSLTNDDALYGPLGGRPDGDESRALKWGTVGSGVVVTLEDIPDRPDTEVGKSEWEEWENGQPSKRLEEMQRVVKIDSGLDFVVALKGNGEVWYRRVKENQSNSWEYVSVT